MKTATFIDIITNKTQIQEVETAELKTVVDQFPYFQAARALYLKGLKNQDSFKYNNVLKLTASYTTDRTVLFNYITTNNFNKKKEDIHQQISEKISNEHLTVKPTNTSEISIEKVEELAKKLSEAQETSEVETEIEDVKESLNIGKPITFSSTENHSFNEWLQISTKTPINREIEKPVKTTSKKDDLINRFIKNNPKIKPLVKDKTIAVSVSKNTQDAALMTETLAKVYLEQKKYENAIQAYRILSLKYPEKSGFFADQIKRVQILQKNKS
ncbi:hypothetical protein [Polaribacter sp.]|uniref:hypothetical protein n=1 Tax=Polaribacter sp. TaxID=1920175 RepID=UPI003EF62459